MGEDINTEVEQFSERVAGVKLARWRYSPDLWRWSPRLDAKHVNLLFRLRSARVIPRSLKARFTSMGIPEDIVDETLGSIRSLDQWGNAWIETAQRFLGDYRRQSSGESGTAADEARRIAAMCYQVAQILILDDDRTISLCRASTSSLFAQAQPRLFPNAHRLRLPWRTTELPAYYILPEDRGTQTGLVVLLNGASTSKEETFHWTRSFIQQGLAVVVIDSPGTGEATNVASYHMDHIDILDGVFELVAEQPNIDPRRVSVLGVSMGGNQALRAMAYDRRIMAGIAVTPTHQELRWIRRVSPILSQQINVLSGDDLTPIEEQISLFDLAPVTPRIRRPVLIFGAARDLLVPPADSQILSAQLGGFSTLVWYPDAGHCLYDRVPQWTSEAATWLTAIGNARIGEGGRGPIEDGRALAEIGRSALMQQPVVAEPERHDDFTDYARMLEPEEVATRTPTKVARTSEKREPAVTVKTP
ncbi:MAG: alpha/beta fold hydrolase [Thermomicrobiales bacterium]